MVMGALYSACLFLGVNNSSSVQPVVSIERTVFYRERAAGMYSALPYAAAQVNDLIMKTKKHSNKSYLFSVSNSDNIFTFSFFH